ncbi:unnamed protein product [Enterobius vermicularis]|uniref:Myeloid leukemia factor n=1 Tax=Enterobius vermicularis TaxID=51028 RepID=A0A0N4VF60_ENTVE|nr:unnamed protein product [Enterobius vermicularis]
MREMDRMMNSMMDPFNIFGNPFGGQRLLGSMLEDGSSRRPVNNNSLSLMNDFGFGGGFFGGLMRHMDDFQNAAMNDPNSHVFSQSTMISYDGTSGGQPKIVEKSVRKTGDVKETRSSVRHGEGGVGDRMAIEHTIGNRTHVIEKKRDRDGRIREQQHFVNLNQNEAEDFDREFATRVRRNFGGTSGERYRAIEHGSGSSRPNLSSETREIRSGATGGNDAPIVTLPEDDVEDEGRGYQRHHTSSARDVFFWNLCLFAWKALDGWESFELMGMRVEIVSLLLRIFSAFLFVIFREDLFRPSSMHRSRHRYDGPIIREIDEEEEEQHRDTKRRKGVFGRLFKANDE